MVKPEPDVSHMMPLRSLAVPTEERIRDEVMRADTIDELPRAANQRVDDSLVGEKCAGRQTSADTGKPSRTSPKRDKALGREPETRSYDLEITTAVRAAPTMTCLAAPISQHRLSGLLTPRRISDPSD